MCSKLAIGNIIITKVIRMIPKMNCYYRLVNKKHGEEYIIRVVNVYKPNGRFNFHCIKVIKPKNDRLQCPPTNLPSYMDDELFELNTKEREELMVDML